MKGGVQTAIGLEANKIGPRGGAARKLSSSDDHPAVRQQNQCVAAANVGRGGNEGRVQTAVGVETGDIVTRRSIETGKIPRDDRFAIGLQRQSVNRGACAGSRV